MRIANHPFWLVGFRPFFTLACLAGLSLPALWALMFNGMIALPTMTISPVQWHAHEMFFGFGWAVLGGFLLTSTKNWVNIRGYHGWPLVLLVAAWLVERLGMWFQGDLPRLVFLVSNHIFLVSIVAMLLHTLIRHRATDSYRDNVLFLIVLPAFLVAKNLMLSHEHFQIGWTATLGLFRMAFLIMLERTLTQFMKGGFQVSLIRWPLLDNSIKLLALALVALSAGPPTVSVVPAILLASLLTIRLALWKPLTALRRIDIGIMVIGYVAIVAQLVLDILAAIAPAAWIGTVSVHIFTFGVMGLIIPAMLIRICRGHTGRKVVFDRQDKLVLWIMLAAFGLRIVAPQLFPNAYGVWIGLAAAGWSASFLLLASRYIPMLIAPRTDGKEH